MNIVRVFAPICLLSGRLLPSAAPQCLPASPPGSAPHNKQIRIPKDAPVLKHRRPRHRTGPNTRDLELAAPHQRKPWGNWWQIYALQWARTYGTGVWAGVVVRSAHLFCLGVPITCPDRRAGRGAAAARAGPLLLRNLVGPQMPSL